MPLMDQPVQCVFLGKDANFPTDAELNGNPASASLLNQYLQNPEGFFNDYPGIHHPFRHADWNIPGHDGRTYHRNFNKLLRHLVGAPQGGNMTPEQCHTVSLWASRISFLELLRFPTRNNSGNAPLFRDFVCGTNLGPQRNRERGVAFERRTTMNTLANQRGYFQQLQLDHLGLINTVLNAPGKRVFVFAGFRGLWEQFTAPQRNAIQQHAPALFTLGNFLQLPRALGQPLPIELQAQVYLHTHFSDTITNAELHRLAEIVSG